MENFQFYKSRGGIYQFKCRFNYYIVIFANKVEDRNTITINLHLIDDLNTHRTYYNN